jgi:N-acetyl sugar amidotransferase
MGHELERCNTCTVPVTWETVHLDSCGTCNICKNWSVKKHGIDWEKRREELLKITAEMKALNNQYDCILPFSGGKDSTYTLWYVVRVLGLKPLVVSFDHGFYRPTMLENRNKTFKKLGVDVITFTPNWHIVKKLMLESLVRKGDFCWHCHAGVFSYPMSMAVKFKIPFLVWGEGGGEYEAYFRYSDIEETDEWKFNRRIVLGMRAEDLAGFIKVDPRDLLPFTYPDKSELEAIGARSLPLGNFIEWDVRKHVEVIKRELDWQEDTIESGFPGETYEKIECMMQGVRDYVKYLKRGFSRITHLTTLDIRHGRMTREEAMRHIAKLEHKKPRSLEVFLGYLGITEDEFNEIVSKHVIHPHTGFDPATIPSGEKLHDQDQWYQEHGNRKE